MAVENRYHIQVNTKSKMFRVVPEIVANDNVVFEIELYDGATLFPLVAGYTYRLVSLKKASGQSVIRDGAAVGGLLVFTLGSSEMTDNGKVEATVQVFDSANKRVSSAKFDYVVRLDPSLQGSLPADDTSLVIANESLLTSAIEKADNADARITNVLSGAAQPSEVVDARGGKPILKDRLDAVDALLADNATQLVNYVGDGVADDTASIQNAINSISKRGKIIFPRNKVLKITSTITIPSNKELVIDGNGSSIYSFVRDGVNPALKLDARTVGETIDGDVPATCRIDNLTIIGGSPTDHSHPTLANKGNANGFEGYDAHRLQMNNVKILGFDKAGLYLNNSYYVSLTNILLRYNKQYGFKGENNINDCELNIKCEYNGVGARLAGSTGTTFMKPLLQGNYQNGLEVDSSQGIVAIDPYWEQNNVSDTADLCNLSVTGGALGDRFTLIGGRFAANFETFFDGSARLNGGHHIICGIPNLNMIGTKFTSLGTTAAGHGGIKFTGSGSSIIGYGLDGQFSQPFTYIEGDGRLHLLGREIQGTESFRIMTDLLFEAGKKSTWYNDAMTAISRTDKNNSITFHDNPVYLRGNNGVIIGGGTWNDNPLILENLYIWRTSDGKQVRYKSTGAPTSETDGWGLTFAPGGFPSTATSPGTVGMICYDSNYAYFCTAPNTWRRTPLSTW